jgi:protein-S-isoprenylcysteine O-methyltransferase Ste14
VLAGTLLAVVVAGALGGGVFDRLSGAGSATPTPESSRARDQPERVFGAGDPNLVLLVTAKRGSVDDPATAAVDATLTRQLVVGGPYRYVRNPTYLAVVAVIVGQAWPSAGPGCWPTPRSWAAPRPPSPTATRSRPCPASSAPSTRPTGALLTAAFVVQVILSVWSAYRTARPSGISRGTWLLILGELSCWTVFGVHRSDPRLLILGLTGVAASLLMLARIRRTTKIQPSTEMERLESAGQLTSFAGTSREV